MLFSGRARATIGIVATALLLVVALASQARAQASTATISGTVRDKTGVLPGATITAKDVQSGFTSDVVSGADGSSAIAGLRPGAYEITVALPQYKPQSRLLRVLLGQSASAELHDLRRSPRGRNGAGHRQSARRHADAGDRDQRHRGPDPLPAAEQPQLPQLRRPRAGRPRLRRRVPQGGHRRARSRANRPTSSSTASATRTTSLEGGVVGQDSSRATRSRRTPCRSSAC